MKKWLHISFISIMAIICIVTILYLSIEGFSYYNTPLAERFYHENHDLFKASGALGHGIGILGTFLIIFGVFSYMIRKRKRILSRFGLLKHWLEFHIFLCTEGAILILFHTSFKFGGIVSISFWSMVAVVVSGIIGRFIYIQIPRTLEGRELNLQELQNLKSDIPQYASQNFGLSQLESDQLSGIIDIKLNTVGKNSMIRFFNHYFFGLKQLSKTRSFLSSTSITRKHKKHLIRIVKKELNLNRKIEWLTSMQSLFKYWHVAHLPFALIMLVIMVIHVGVTLLFGYKWIF